MSSENTFKQDGESKGLIKNMSSFFIKNAAQLNSNVKYYSLNGNFSCYLTSQEAVFSFIKIDNSQENIKNISKIQALKKNTINSKNTIPLKNVNGVALYLKFLGANENVEIAPDHECSCKINYLKCNDSSKWCQNVPAYEKIVYKNLWNNIDLVFSSVKGQLKYEFIINSGASADDIKLSYIGGDSISLDNEGNLIISTALGSFTDKKPLTYQMIENKKVIIESSFILKTENMFSFEVDSNYDKNNTLVIDPGLEYSTYLGGNDDFNNAIAIDNNGNAYVTGYTFSTNFPTTPGVFQPTDPDEFNVDAFISKIDTNASGINSLIFSTYLGGNNFDSGQGIAVDKKKNVYITGYTDSKDFPTTSTAYQPSVSDSSLTKAFLTKLSANGSELLYSTYLGGDSFDFAYGIAVDNNSNAYMTGTTSSNNFPTTPKAYQPVNPDSDPVFSNAFITKINTKKAGNASLVYSSYLGGNSFDEGFGIAIDKSDNAYITGYTWSSDFPTTPKAYQTCAPDSNTQNAFVSKISINSSKLLYSTYLGGNGEDVSRGIAIDKSGNAYITGYTASTNFPTTPSAYQHSKPNIDWDTVFVSKINTLKLGNSSLSYSTYLGGNNFDIGNAIAVDNNGNAYVTGETNSSNFPATPTAFQPSPPDTDSDIGPDNAFISKINTLASREASLAYSTYLGGNSFDGGFGIKVDNEDNAYISGYTLSTDFPTTCTAYQSSDPSPDSVNVFITKINAASVPPFDSKKFDLVFILLRIVKYLVKDL
ncbi:MAG: SBBP repeat-containing protein [Clostridium sp.]|uniref:SBBP repeat-containing protein n=1 Tax=Clostridium sp. TaxID=1506 RepID=UPI0025B8BBD7|nr:SBBP repeat-containing protein [Clostridium sp.]MCE5219752.1 SBBP repeat-containing protein [Clostridium sp.]